jgi:hypothetical protein
MPPARDLTNKQFGFLLALRRIHGIKSKDGPRAMWLFRCLRCGAEKIICGRYAVRAAISSSCGCYRRELGRRWKGRRPRDKKMAPCRGHRTQGEGVDSGRSP